MTNLEHYKYEIINFDNGTFCENFVAPKVLS